MEICKNEIQILYITIFIKTLQTNIKMTIFFLKNILHCTEHLSIISHPTGYRKLCVFVICKRNIMQNLFF